MKKEIADKWVEALRSGKYEQGKSVLCKIGNGREQYCCLGVLCDILETPYSMEDSCKNYGYKNYDKEAYALPYAVMLQTEMNNCIGRLDEFTTLSSLNDNGRSFSEIANVIEENWEIL